MCCVIIRSLLKHTDLNVTEFLQKNQLATILEDCAFSGLLQDLSDKIKQFIKYGNIFFKVHFSLRYSKFK